jgi:hypothetical protein
MANPDKYTTGPRKGKLKLPAIRKLIREHAKASKINLDKLTYDQTLEKLKLNGFIINHEKMRVQTSTRLKDGEIKTKRQFLIEDKSKPKPKPKTKPKANIPPAPPPPPPRGPPPPPPPPLVRKAVIKKKISSGPPQLGDLLKASKGLRKTTTNINKKTGMSEEEIKSGLKGLRKTPVRKEKVIELTEFQKELKRRVLMKANKEKKKVTRKDIDDMIKTLKIKKVKTNKKEALDASRVLREILKK